MSPPESPRERPNSSLSGLRCLHGESPPPELAGDLHRLLELPEAARQRLWEALGPSLPEPIPSGVERQLDAFCARHGIAGDELARTLKACRFLVRESAKRNLDRAAFAEDVAVLTGDHREIRELLLARFEQAKALVRQELLRDALLNHGKVLTGVDWRLDTITTSAQGADLRARVAILTLTYQEGERKERTTLQVTPDALEELRQACERMLAG